MIIMSDNEKTPHSFGGIATPNGILHITDENIFNCIQTLDSETKRLMRENSRLRLELFELKYKPKKKLGI